ncbi:MAG: two-component sensor histidine kinase [Alphaproteobacteria bacterium]|nr:two-component sensor histidine kinase [Alphaproteobacteria bacterium]
MNRFVPRSLIGQMALLIGIALLIAQVANFALILNERQKLSLAQNQGPAITRFVALASDLAQAPPEFRYAVIQDGSRRGAQFRVSRSSNVPETSARTPEVEDRLRQSLASAGIESSDVRAALTTIRRSSRSSASRSGAAPTDLQLLLLSARTSDGWLNGRIVTPRPDPWLSARLAGATLFLYLVVLGATLFIAGRLARPLRDLTEAAETFGGREIARTVAPTGPSDLRRAIEAFNAMNSRVSALLDEKDRMLGAIGHDLRTPLASLRIRAESVEPESERDRMIATIEEMAAMLEDILVLARSGRAREEGRVIDLAALADAVVEQYRELGRPVTFLASERQVATVQPNLMRRAVRNLVDNAVKYGGSARVAVWREQDAVLVEVADDGPGLPADQLGQVLEPFYRAEASRNRETGGAGLGLAIAKAVAESHGGNLRLRNGETGGLVATISVPGALS